MASTVHGCAARAGPAQTARTASMLYQNFLDRRAVIDIQPFASRHIQFLRIEPELMQDRRMNVRHVMPVFDGMESDLVGAAVDRKSTRLNSSHSSISYAVFCLKKK